MDGSASTTMRERLAAGLRAALKSRDAAAVAALRSALSALDNAQSVAGPSDPMTSHDKVAKARLGVGVAEVARRDLSRDQVLAVLRQEIEERSTAAAEYERLGRPQDAARLLAEATALTPYIKD